MKTNAILSAALAVSAAALLPPTAHANIALPQIEMHSQLAHEQVDIRIQGDQAEVTGTFRFVKTVEDYYDLTFYLPVYAAEGTAVKEFQPEITMDAKPLEVVFVKKEWESDRRIAGFGALPQLEGQRVHWFVIGHVPQQPGQKEMVLKIRYTQKLANGKFIYTPLIPHQKEGKDYGSITVSADRPYRLLDAEKHGWASREAGVMVIEPADKRAIVVEMAEAAPKIP